MLGNSSGSWQRRLTSSEAGSPAKQTGGPGHPRNWRCGCKPGILGPPKSPIPPLLRSAVELTATGPPISWKLTQDPTLTKIELTWTTNLDSPSNPLLLFPPPLLTLISSLAAEPSCWSLESSNGLLLCSLAWSAAAATAEPAAIAEPASPPPSSLNDSGYCSPTRSPIPFNLPRDDDIGVQRSPFPLNKSLDAATSTSTPTTCSSSTQTPQPSSSAQVGSQTAPPPTKQTCDAAVATVAPDSVSCSSQTPSITTSHSTTQASLPDLSKISHQPEPPAIPPPCTTDAGTFYDPPPTVIPRWCRLCSCPVLPDTKPLSHLLSCDGIPHLLGAECEGLFNDWSDTLGLPIDTLATMTELLLTTFDPSPKEPSTTAFNSKDFLIAKLIPRSGCSYTEYPKFWSHLVNLTTSLSRECYKLLQLPPNASLSTLFSTIDPEISETTDVDDEDLGDYEAYHPYDDLEHLPEPTDYESDSYFVDEY